MSFLFGAPKLDRDELSKCMEWLGKQYEITGFQDKEAELYNNAILRDGNSLTTSPEAAMRIVKAVKRMVQAATELVVRNDNMKPIPEAATAAHYAWSLVFMQWKSWATAQCTAIESMAEGSNPRSEYVQELMQQFATLEEQAKKEEEKLLKRMNRSGATLADIQKLITKANQTLSKNNWQPSSN